MQQLKILELLVQAVLPYEKIGFNLITFYFFVNNKMYLIIVLVCLVCILWKLPTLQKLDKNETFQAAWNDYVIYANLSRRLRIGVTKSWLNLNGLALSEEFFRHANVEVVLYYSIVPMLDSLLKNKHIDVVFVTEADYALYVSKKLNIISLDQNYVNKNKHQIKKNFTARRLFTLNKIYRVFIGSNIQISKPTDITNKTVQITNITNKIYQLDLHILKNIKYNKIYENEENANSLYGTINNIGLRMDGYFMDIDNPNSNMKQYSHYKNITMIDLYGGNNPFTSSDIILEKHFCLTKDKMDLSAYPEIIERRKQVIKFNELPYNPKEVNCYSSKVIGITREDVEDEWIYLFTESISKHLDIMLHEMNLPSFSKKEMYSSKLNDILPAHPAIYNPKKYKTD
jgi:hypothetical protein